MTLIRIVRWTLLVGTWLIYTLFGIYAADQTHRVIYLATATILVGLILVLNEIQSKTK